VTVVFPARSVASDRQAPDGRPAWLIIVAAAVLTIFYYGMRMDLIGVARSGGDWTAMTRPVVSLLRHNVAAAVLLGLIPLVVARRISGLHLGRLGLGMGNRRRGLVWIAVGVPIAIILGKLSAGHPDVRAVYPLGSGLTRETGPFLTHAITQLLYYGAWEVLFRGVLLHGLQPRFGFTGSNALQTALSVVAHFGRPFSETMAALPAGLAFGGVARNTGSIWPVVIIHWTAGVAQDWFIVS